VNILGISAFYHDSAAALVRDGSIVAAAQEERFTRKKHDHDFPQNAIDYCLAEAGIGPEDLSYVAFYEKPLTKFERIVETHLAYAPASVKSFFRAVPLWVRQKLHLPREMSRGLRGRYAGRFIFTDHHESHAASAFFPSPFEEAAILTVDGVGEWSTAATGAGRGNRIELTHHTRFPHSLGLLYSAFTYYTGFRVNSGEYKLMGLAPYGEPRYAGLIREKLLDLKDDGSFRMNMGYFNYCRGLTMTNRRFHRLFGAPPRDPEVPLTQHTMDVAASVQKVTEEVMLRAARWVHERTGMERLVMAGGVALNCCANGRLLREGPFREIWIQPAAGDAGGALGAALLVWHQVLEKPRNVNGQDAQQGSFLGPSFSDEAVREFLRARGAAYRTFQDESELIDRVSDLIAAQKVVGWFQGRMEFGPRALGGRSIVADARSRDMQKTLNLKIKFRESFRPFAPAVLRERASEYFEMEPGRDSPYMLLVAPVRAEKRQAPAAQGGGGAKGLSLLGQVQSDVPAITHVDYSARVQTVDPDRHGRFYRLIKRFEQKTGCPLVVNTSFNIRGEPIVCDPPDAYQCFMGTNMDALVMERQLLLKSEQPDATHYDVDSYKARFQLD